MQCVYVIPHYNLYSTCISRYKYHKFQTSDLQSHLNISILSKYIINYRLCKQTMNYLSPPSFDVSSCSIDHDLGRARELFRFFGASIGQRVPILLHLYLQRTGTELHCYTLLDIS